MKCTITARLPNKTRAIHAVYTLFSEMGYSRTIYPVRFTKHQATFVINVDAHDAEQVSTAINQLDSFFEGNCLIKMNETGVLNVAVENEG